MSATQTGMAVGAVLAIVALEFGFWALVFTAVAIALGALVARIIVGRIDISELTSVLRGGRSSS